MSGNLSAGGQAGLLTSYGWDERFAAAFAPWEGAGLQPGRVVAEHRGQYRLATAEVGDRPARVAGSLRRPARSRADFPAVGDWVACQFDPEGGHALIGGVLPRRSSLIRKVAGRVSEEQVLAANVDYVFLVNSLRTAVNRRRTERALVLVWESGATPVILLSQADLCPDPEAERRSLEAVALGAPVHIVSSLTGEGIADLAAYFAGNPTAVLLGVSGAGKSTLINRLAGRDILRVQAVRADGKGRHTTTYRELFPLPGGGLIIDTPGLRELQLWEGAAGLTEAFEDIEKLAAGCRFPDCRHATEPGCAVVEAISAERLPAERLAAYQKLQREIIHHATRRDERAQQAGKRAVKSIERGMKDFRQRRGGR